MCEEKLVNEMKHLPYASFYLVENISEIEISKTFKY